MNISVEGAFLSSTSRDEHTAAHPSRPTVTTNDMESADELLGALTAFRGTNAVGAKAVADAIKKEAAATENFMVWCRCALFVDILLYVVNLVEFNNELCVNGGSERQGAVMLWTTKIFTQLITFQLVFSEFLARQS